MQALAYTLRELKTTCVTIWLIQNKATQERDYKRQEVGRWQGCIQFGDHPLLVCEEVWIKERMPFEDLVKAEKGVALCQIAIEALINFLEKSVLLPNDEYKAMATRAGINSKLKKLYEGLPNKVCPQVVIACIMGSLYGQGVPTSRKDIRKWGGTYLEFTRSGLPAEWSGGAQAAKRMRKGDLSRDDHLQGAHRAMHRLWMKIHGETADLEDFEVLLSNVQEWAMDAYNAASEGSEYNKQLHAEIDHMETEEEEAEEETACEDDAGVQIFTAHNKPVLSVAISRDGTMLASGSEDKTVRVWDVATGKCTILHGGHEGHKGYKSPKSHKGAVTSVAFHPKDSTKLASGSKDKTVRVWDVATGKCTATLKGHSGVVTSVAFHPKGSTTLASGSKDKTVRVWDVATRKSTILKDHTGAVTSVAFSPKSSTKLASGSNDKTVRLWDVATGECTFTLEGHSGGVTSVAFSPNGTMLASGSKDKAAWKVCLWNVATGGLTFRFKGDHGVTSLAFNPKDGTKLASGCSDETVRVWDMATRHPGMATLQGYTAGVFSVAFSPDGTKLASAITGQVSVYVRDMAKQHGVPTARKLPAAATIVLDDSDEDEEGARPRLPVGGMALHPVALSGGAGGGGASSSTGHKLQVVPAGSSGQDRPPPRPVDGPVQGMLSSSSSSEDEEDDEEGERTSSGSSSEDERTTRRASAPASAAAAADGQPLQLQCPVCYTTWQAGALDELALTEHVDLCLQRF